MTYGLPIYTGNIKDIKVLAMSLSILEKYLWDKYIKDKKPKKKPKKVDFKETLDAYIN